MTAMAAEHRSAVVRRLVDLADDVEGCAQRQAVTARSMHAVEPHVSVDGWLSVLADMARLGHAGDTARLLYVGELDITDPTRTEYALSPVGWRSGQKYRRADVAALAADRAGVAA